MMRMRDGNEFMTGRRREDERWCDGAWVSRGARAAEVSEKSDESRKTEGHKANFALYSSSLVPPLRHLDKSTKKKWIFLPKKKSDKDSVRCTENNTIERPAE